MKKNGKKYRALHKELEARKQNRYQNTIHINQEVDDLNIALLAVSQIAPYNPIVYDNPETKNEYLNRLHSYVRAGKWNKRKYIQSQLQAYENIINTYDVVKEQHDISFYKYFLLLDTIHILGYDILHEKPQNVTAFKEKLISDFQIKPEDILVDKIIKTFSSYDAFKRISTIMRYKSLIHESEYLNLMRKNIKFLYSKPAGIMVTATMSAGKSTFINALTGKYICLSQNMACTSKIHIIVNKTFEDGYSYEYDHDLVMTAGKEELLNDNELNSSDRIVVGTHFTGNLSDKRIIINDSPGVNYSENQEHKIITNKLIKKRNYNLLIYIMNASQLGTTDDLAHINFVKSVIGKTPVIFVINQIDRFNPDEEDILSAIENQRKLLIKNGFKSPILCPVSARAGYLSKKFRDGSLTKSENRELSNFIDKFEKGKIDLVSYYTTYFSRIKVDDSPNEEEQLQKTCGLSYVEKLIVAYAAERK